MKFTNLQHKTISMIVLLTFVVLLHFSATPAQAASNSGNSETTIAQGNSNGPGFIEEESSSEPVIKKGKKFPILFVALGVVAIGVAVYFLVIKKPDYTLTVNLGTGCTGTPAATAKYKKDTAVAYNYTAPAGYMAQVKLDGVAVPASGTVTMDKDHTLDVTSEIDIRGTWNFKFRATNVSKNWTWSFKFTGDGKSGPVMIYIYPGTYTVSGNNITWQFSGYNISGTGTFSSKDALSGTATLVDVKIGDVLVTAANWTATRSGTTASIPASQSAAAKISKI